MLAIKNNMMAENAARNLGTSYNALAKSVERLSSGLRINSAKDDAAGLAVRELIRADVAALKQGSRNAADAVSMLQSAEGGLAIIDNILVRMRELAEQAATGSYSADQKDMMQAEFAQLADEIDRIADNTDFNDNYLLNSGTTTKTISLGSGTSITLSSQDMTATGLGITGTKGQGTFATWVADSGDDWVTVTTGGDLEITIAGQDAINVTLAAADYSMDDIVELINAESRSVENYNAASIVTDDVTGMQTIQVLAKTGGVAAVTIAGDGTLASTNTIIETAANWAVVDGTGADLDISDDAAAAITAINNAITSKDQFRAELGYMMNRLEAAASVIDIQAENLSTAESRISDVDVATEMAAMTRNNVLAQAGVSMLAQANQMPQMAMQLLRG
ncbi:MAG: flagellin [Phycisphaerae bacterium]|jgi:flagellin